VRPDAREVIGARLAAGASVRSLAVEFGCSGRTVQRIAVEAALARPRALSGRRLSFSERERISRGIAAGESDTEIARALGRHRSTIGREIRATGGGQRRSYRALAGERGARARARRPKPGKLWSSPALVDA
jgi:DNA-binding CsgD family transcriptional regulator